MSDESTNHNLLIGIALAAGVIGAVTSFLRSNHQIGESLLAHPGKKIPKCCSVESTSINKNFLIGGIVGGLLGATAALMLAPKPGSELIHDVAQKLDISIETEKPQAADEKVQKKKRTRKPKDDSKNIELSAKTKLSPKKKANPKGKGGSVKKEAAIDEAFPESPLP